MLSERHSLQLEVGSLKRENKAICDKFEGFQQSSQEEINMLRLENKALKEKLNHQALKQVDAQFLEQLVTKRDKDLSERKKDSVGSLLCKRLFFNTALRSIYEILI